MVVHVNIFKYDNFVLNNTKKKVQCTSTKINFFKKVTNESLSWKYKSNYCQGNDFFIS
jgi:hypothetical protein